MFQFSYEMHVKYFFSSPSSIAVRLADNYLILQINTFE